MITLYKTFWQKLVNLKFNNKVIESLRAKTEEKLISPVQGDYPRWLQAFKNLPEMDNINIPDRQNAVSCQSQDSVKYQQQIKQCYQQLIPWRKGPFDMFSTFIDSEWQSYMKWNRIEHTIPDLENKMVLDVGCGNGYYMFRMLQKNPLLLMGIDPGLLQIMQFWSIEKYRKSGACVLPLAMENMPDNLQIFDVVFSMGVLYHRKSPIHHIKELAGAIKSRGYLVLETLIIDGDEKSCLLPTGRYAQMRNVWFLPSVAMLTIMLQRNGFKNIKCIDTTTTTMEEQRSTEWMKFHSLQQFLNEDQSKTIEGYALPQRATLVAERF